MNPHRTRDSILTVIGCAALLIYILACASFSPDDSKIVFPSWDPATGSLSVNLYDRSARTTESLLVLPAEEQLFVRPGWTPDGTRVVALWFDNSSSDRLQVALLPFKSKGATRVLSVSNVDEVGASIAVPPQILGASMFLSAESSVLRLDLGSGEVTEREIGGEARVLVRQGRVYYGRKVPATAGSDQKLLEVGRLDANTLECTPILQTSEGDDRGFLTVSQDGSRIAVGIKKDDLVQVLVFSGKDLIATIPFGTPADKLELGNVVFAPDASMLYAVFVKPLADDEHHQFGVLELPANGGPSRQIPLFVAGDIDDTEPSAFEIDLSHDGKMLAGASTYLWSDKEGKLKADDLALYLIDLSRADRKVTKIPIPAPPKAKAEAEKK